MKTALITGIRGQDAAYLSKYLLENNYHVLGTDRRSGGSSTWRLDRLGITRDIEYIPMDLLEQENINQVIRTRKPDEVYNLAAQSFVAVSFEQPFLTTEVNAMGPLRILSAIKNYSPETRFYQASTSELMGKVQEMPQTEKTPFYPRSPYGVAKLFAHWSTINYRESYDMFACCGILYNHESPLRGAEFITRKVSLSAARIANGLEECLTVGNINAKRDWGHSADFVRAMYLMLQQETPEDYVIATGEMHSVKEFITAAFLAAGIRLRWYGQGVDEHAVDDRDIIRVRISPEFYRPAEVEMLLGDASKAEQGLGWKPEISFDALVTDMVTSDLKYL